MFKKIKGLQVEMAEYTELKVNKLKLEKIKTLYKAKTEQEIIDQILDDILYMSDMLKHMKQFEGKGNFKQVYV